MALTSTRSQDHPLMDGLNAVPGVPKSGYTPVKGHLVKREFAQADEWDLCAAGEVPEGLVFSDNSGNGTVSVYELKGWGATVILQRSGAVTLGNTITCTATALGTTIGRTVVQDAGAWSAGLPRITASDPRGTNTVEVFFP